MNDYIAKTDAFIASLGVEAYRVGGSVRDEILGRRVKDADYMVRGVDLPTLGDLLVAQGREYKVGWLKDRDGRPLGARVARKGLGVIEITLPRKEISTGPGHRDFDIVLDPTLPLHEDAKRRDFTFNALYKAVSADGTGLVADPTNTGLYDLEHRLVRTTYPTSFRDDPLRILRALRFVSVLGYDVNSETLDQMAEHASSVTGLTYKGREATSQETLPNGWTLARKRMPGDQAKAPVMSGTVYEEMCKLLMGPDAAKALRIAASQGVLGTLFPELAPMIGYDQGSRYHDLTTDEHTFAALETACKVDAPLRVRWALLFHDAGKPDTAWRGTDLRKHYYHKEPPYVVPPIYQMDHEDRSEQLWNHAAERMNVPAALRKDVATLIREHMVAVSGRIKTAKINRERVRLGDGLLRDLYLHRMCDVCGKGRPNKAHLAHLAEQEIKRQWAQDNGVPASVKQLKVGGKDAINAGLDGRRIGEVLAQILDEVVAQPDEQKLSREWQLSRLEKIAGVAA